MSGARLSAWLLHGLHLGLGLAIPLLFLMFVGCKKISEETVDYGAEVSGDAIDFALSKAIHGASLDGLAMNQYLDYSVVRRLENEDTTSTMGATQVKVIDRVEQSNNIKYTLRITKSVRVSRDSFETRVSEEDLLVKKPSLMNLGQSETLGLGMGQGLNSLARLLPSEVTTASIAARTMADNPTRKVTRVSYHRLKEFTAGMPAPKTIRERPGCNGLANCELQVRYIQFDMVQWYDDNTQIKVSLDFGFALEPPYLPFGEAFDQFTGLMVIDCRSTYVPIDSRTVYVRDCMSLEDYQK